MIILLISMYSQIRRKDVLEVTRSFEATPFLKEEEEAL